MITSKEVFAKRKEGAIDEAYQLALQLMGAPDVGEWDRKAMGWCLVDLIKRDAEAGNRQNLEHYRRQLEQLEVAQDDDMLQKGIRNALSLCSPNGPLIKQASLLSKEGQYAEAVTLYRQALAQGTLDSHAQTSFGWDLYKHARQVLAANHVNFSDIKRGLNDYLKLDVEKPSLLHTCILQLGSKLAGHEKLNMLKFLQLWDLQYLRDEDWQRHRADDGKKYPSLVERVIRQAGKDAIASGNAEDLDYILPHVEAAVHRFPDNVWLKMDKAKLLLTAGRHEDALTFGIAVAKAKADEYWAWELLGDIMADTEPGAARDCYCKALCCPAEDKFTGKVRLKLARLLIGADDLARAKYEVETVMRQRKRDGLRVPEAAAEIVSQPWFASTQTNRSSEKHYRVYAEAAEALLSSKLPWIAANVGDRFVVPGLDDKPKRRIFVSTPSEPFEVSIPENKFAHRDLAPGDGLRIKGEFDEAKRFKIYALEARTTECRWDVFPERVGVVDHVNPDKGVLHFIVDRAVDGVIALDKLSTQFQEGDAIAVKLSKYSTKRGQVYRVVHAGPTDHVPSTQVLKHFTEEVRISNGLGFTTTDIFIPPPFVAEHQIQDGQTVSGVAILNYNKKRQNWGWKAISVATDDSGSKPT